LEIQRFVIDNIWNVFQWIDRLKLNSLCMEGC